MARFIEGQKWCLGFVRNPTVTLGAKDLGSASSQFFGGTKQAVRSWQAPAVEEKRVHPPTARAKTCLIMGVRAGALVDYRGYNSNASSKAYSPA